MITLFRIDDRLIHGQVMTSWSKVTQAKRIVIVDDNVVNDTFVCMVMKRAIPKEIKLEIFNLEDGIEFLLNHDDSLSTIVLMKTSEVALKIIDAGVNVKDLNVGGMAMKPGRKNVYKNIALSPEEIEEFKKIAEKGIEIEFKILPGDRGATLNSVI